MSGPQPITITCPACSAVLALPPADFKAAQGSTIICPACQTTLAIPAAPQPPSGEPEESTFNRVFGRTCEHCGTSVPPGPSSCPKCGKRLHARAAHASAMGHLPGFAGQARQQEGMRLPMEWIRRVGGTLALGLVLLIGWNIHKSRQRTKIDRAEADAFSQVEAQIASADTWQDQIAAIRAFLSQYPMGRRVDAAHDLIAQLEKEQREAGVDFTLTLDVALVNEQRLPFEGNVQILAFTRPLDDVRKELDRNPIIRRLRSPSPPQTPRPLEAFDAIGEFLAAQGPRVLAVATPTNGIVTVNGLAPGTYALYGAGTAGPNRVGIFSNLIVPEQPGEAEFFPEYYAALRDPHIPPKP